jgi:hypothetical protein
MQNESEGGRSKRQIRHHAFVTLFQTEQEREDLGWREGALGLGRAALQVCQCLLVVVRIVPFRAFELRRELSLCVVFGSAVCRIWSSSVSYLAQVCRIWFSSVLYLAIVSYLVQQCVVFSSAVCRI